MQVLCRHITLCTSHIFPEQFPSKIKGPAERTPHNSLMTLLGKRKSNTHPIWRQQVPLQALNVSSISISEVICTICNCNLYRHEVRCIARLKTCLTNRKWPVAPPRDHAGRSVSYQRSEPTSFCSNFFWWWWIPRKCVHTLKFLAEITPLSIKEFRQTIKNHFFTAQKTGRASFQVVLKVGLCRRNHWGPPPENDLSYWPAIGTTSFSGRESGVEVISQRIMPVWQRFSSAR